MHNFVERAIAVLGKIIVQKLRIDATTVRQDNFVLLGEEWGVRRYRRLKQWLVVDRMCLHNFVSQRWRDTFIDNIGTITLLNGHYRAAATWAHAPGRHNLHITLKIVLL